MSEGADLGEILAPEVLARRVELPRKPAAVDLAGTHVTLRPLDLARDVGALHRASCGEALRVGDRSCDAYDADALVWRYMGAGPFADAEALGAVLREQLDSPDGTPLTVLDAATSTPVGVVNYLANHPEHLKIELGAIWYSPVVQRSSANAEATYLLLRHAFGLGYRRIEWKCDSKNERSRRAALRMGFVFEGIQQAHYIVKGRNRDTAWYRMLADEWLAASERLKALIRSA